MKAKKLALALMALALASCSSGGGNSGDSSSVPLTEAHLSSKLDSKLYGGPNAEGGLDESGAMSLPTSFFTDVPDVPYVTLKDFVENIYDRILAQGGVERRVSVEGNKLKNRVNGTTMTFDAGKNEISCEDLDLFLSEVASDKIHSDIVMAISDTSAKLVEGKSSRTAGKKIAWNMSKYYMQLLSYEGSVYVPYSVLQTLFLNKLGLSIGFNGNNYYLNSIMNMGMYEDPKAKVKALNGYGTSFYGGSMGVNYVRSDSYCKYFYGSFLFAMENFAGKTSEYALDDLDATFEASGEKAKLMSTNSVEADLALANVLIRHFSDGGHTGFTAMGCTAGADLARDISTWASDAYVQDRRVGMSQSTVKPRLQEFRTEAQKSEVGTKLTDNVTVSGETAVITLDSFTVNKDEQGMPIWANKSNVSSDKTSTFGIFYNSFEAIKENGSIENVIIDVSLNGGGAAPALGEALGFLTNDDITLTTYNPVTGARNVETMKYDTDLDGDFDDDDAPGADYNLYILTSLCSFSCGNAFPCVASDYGYAKIIGQRSGGGDCAVTYGCAPDGSSWSMSSTISIRHKDFTSVDRGAIVDASVNYPNFYDLSYLDTFVKGLASASGTNK